MLEKPAQRVHIKTISEANETTDLTFVGACEGDRLGLFEGADVGGGTVGDPVGLSVTGAFVGGCVGEAVGLLVTGALVGDGVGGIVGGAGPSGMMWQPSYVLLLTLLIQEK